MSRPASGPRLDTSPISATKMLFVGGGKQSYHCEVCGSNCFHHPKADDESKYECNGCGAWYTSDSPERNKGGEG